MTLSAGSAVRRTLWRNQWPDLRSSTQPYCWLLVADVKCVTVGVRFAARPKPECGRVICGLKALLMTYHLVLPILALPDSTMIESLQELIANSTDL